MKILISFIVCLLVFPACKFKRSNDKEDLTCWAHTAADIAQAEGLDKGKNVYKQLVKAFGNKEFYVVDSLRWWLHEIGESPSMVRAKYSGDFEDVAYWLFEDGAKAVGFMDKRKKYNHFLTAYRYGDLDGYNVVRLIWIRKAQP